MRMTDVKMNFLLSYYDYELITIRFEIIRIKNQKI